MHKIRNIDRRWFTNNIHKEETHIKDISYDHIFIDLKTDMISDEGFKTFLAVINFTDGSCDAEPMKDKTPVECLKAYKEIVKRGLITNIKNILRISCDGGSEFLGAFKSYCEKNGIQIIVENTDYHINATSPVERLIGSLTRYIKIDLAIESVRTGRHANKWVPLLRYYVNLINKSKKQKYNVKDLNKDIILHKRIIPIGDVVFKKLPGNYTVFYHEKMKSRNEVMRFSTKPSVVTGYFTALGRPLMYYLNGENERHAYYRHDLLHIDNWVIDDKLNKMEIIPSAFEKVDTSEKIRRKK